MLMVVFSLSSMLLLPMITPLFMWISASTLSIMMIPIAIMLMSSTNYSAISEISSIDAMSSTLIILTMWVTAMMIVASNKIFIQDVKPKTFTITLTVLLMMLLACFSSSNIFTFYIWFEASLIPTMFLIMSWGYQPERAQASMYLMIYTVTASLPMLTMFMKIFYTSKTGSMFMFMMMLYPNDIFSITMTWMITMAGFLVKLPMFTVHLWLPKAHVEAPISGSMILAAILLKLGGYGILRLYYLFPFTAKFITPALSSIALSGAVITSLICFRQSDLKSLIAYSSVGHMGLMVAGASTMNMWGFQAALAMMIAHGLSSSALFVLANNNYEIHMTRSLYLIKGMMVTFPILTLWWFLFTAINMAAPPSINLMSEIMLITSILSSSIMSLIPLSLMSFFTAAYSLYMYTSITHGSSILYTNPTSPFKMSNFTLLIMHMYPAIAIILKPEMIASWT